MGTRNRKLWSSKAAIKLLMAGKVKLGKVVCQLRMSPVIGDKDDKEDHIFKKCKADPVCVFRTR